MNQKNIKGHGLAAVTIFIWGTTFLSTKILLAAFTPIEILFYRFILGFLALSLIPPKRLKVTSLKEEGLFALAGLCGITLYYLFENIALTYTLVSNVGVVVSASPFFTAILAALFLRSERPGLPFFIGFIVAIAGVSLISFNGAAVLKLNPLGDFLALAAAFIWAIYSILTKKISNLNYNIIATTRRIFFYGLLFMIFPLLFMDFHLEPALLLEAAYLPHFLFLGLMASAMCFVTWNTAVSILGAVQTSIYIYAVPVITVTMSALLLKEPVTPMSLLGTVLTLLGLLISEGRLLKAPVIRKRHV